MNHRRSWGILIILLASAWILSAQETPLSNRIASYDIQVRLDTERKMLKAKEILHWKNTSPDTIREVQFHLYYNAFKNTRSTFYKEARGVRDPISPKDADAVFGWINVDQIVDDQGRDLTATQRFLHPDDDNEYDQTVVAYDLAEGLLPGESIDLTIHFTSKIPRVRIRSGYNRDFHHLAQWFPKIGVYEAPGVRYAKKGQWNCHQYHSSSEYYADFGVYNVDITVPQNYIVGASGVLQKTTIIGQEKTFHFRAEDVIDFAWTASPHFVEHLDRWKNVNIRLLTYPEHVGLAERHLLSAKQTMEYLDQYVGHYPYTTLTIICPPMHGTRAGAMEYPTLITTAGFAHMPSWVPTVETLTVHEFVHQYFMAMVATNEFEESWLDEGITSYFENRIMDHYYGPKTSTFQFMGFRVGDSEQSRQGYVGLANPKIAENFRPTWEFRHGSYRGITYNKTPTWLKTLEGLVGWDTMNEIMRTYFTRWKFRHPCATDFIAIVNEVVKKNHGDRYGANMDWFFDQVLYNSEVCDYKVATITNRLIKKDWGIFSTDTTWHYVETPGAESPTYHSRVILHRLGEVKFPQDVLIRFENGEEVMEHWDGQERTYEFSYYRPHQVEWAHIDPAYKIDMDLNFNNNSYTTRPKATALQKYAAKFMLFIQNIMQTMSFLV